MAARIGITDSPSDTLIQGQIVKGGKVIAGDSRPLSFWFGQTALPTTDPWGWGYSADQGDPPASGGIMNAIGGAGPLIAGALTYGVGNQYKPGGPANVPEPPIGQPPPAALPYLIQRNNATFKDANSRPPQKGKTILAYCSNKRMILVAVQPDGVLTGQTHAGLAFALAQRGFDAAVFLDGSDSATMIFEGRVVVAPGDRKNATIDVGVGFFN